MPLTQAQKSNWERARALGAGRQSVRLTDDMCRYLIARVADDLEILHFFPEFPRNIFGVYTQKNIRELVLEGPSAVSLFERLIELSPDADTYFACLASLHKARLKYQAILETQPIPNIEQVGPRGLLQYGTMSPAGLGALLFWRKWFFDIDNRAGQETGYLFEPVIASAVGGTPIPAARSPVRRIRDNSKGRQIDCLIGEHAYEIKVRVTIAASGQGRWGEELEFPVDCNASGYKPILVVLDSTENPKLTALSRAFYDNGGEVYIGGDAWAHLVSLAGDTMSLFVEKYVREPLDHIFNELPSPLPSLTISQKGSVIEIIVGEETFKVYRADDSDEVGSRDTTPDDHFSPLPGA